MQEKSMQRKGQMTIVLILGMTLLIITGLTIYLTSSTVKKKTTETTSLSQTSTQEVTPIFDFITSCLKSSTEEGLELLGKQGGYLFKSQGGPYPDFLEEQEGVFFRNYQGYRVAYGISQGRITLPNYPSAYSPFGPSPPQKSGSGLNTFPALNGSFSMRSQLEFYIQNKTEECLDLSLFEDQGFVIERGEMESEVFFGPEETISTIHYPISITYPKSGEKATRDSFTSSLPIRMNSIHDASQQAILLETNDILSMPDQRTIDGISLSIFPSDVETDDVFIIRDERSRLLGKPFEMFFARHNRNPALFYLSRNSSFDYSSTDGLNFSLETNISEELLFSYIGHPKGVDPDEDEITYDVRIDNLPSKQKLPYILTLPEIWLKISVSDSSLEDHQIIKIKRHESQ